MNKKALAAIGLVVAVGAAILWLQSANQQSQLQDKVRQAGQAQSVREGQVAVAISGFAFRDQVIKVKKGTTVTWTNQDNAPHTVTSDEGNLLDSPVMNRDGKYQKTFEATGTYYYHCTPHPNMRAAVIVVD